MDGHAGELVVVCLDLMRSRNHLIDDWLLEVMTREVLLDTDPGCDDAVALALALASDELEGVRVTTVAGNITIENATRNALRVLRLFDRSDGPVATEGGQPLAHDLETAEGIQE